MLVWALGACEDFKLPFRFFDKLHEWMRVHYRKCGHRLASWKCPSPGQPIDWNYTTGEFVFVPSATNPKVVDTVMHRASRMTAPLGCTIPTSMIGIDWDMEFNWEARPAQAKQVSSDGVKRMTSRSTGVAERFGISAGGTTCSDEMQQML